MGAWGYLRGRFEPFGNATRKALYEAIADRGSARIVEIAAALGVNESTARYHAQVLVHVALLAPGGPGRFRVPTYHEDTLEDKIRETVERTPGIHLSALARTLGVSRSCVEEHVTRLILANRLERRAIDGARRLFVPVHE
ncbi:MAG: hypothetical protein ACYDDF_13025 [Thermoplasmatota archaeon]